MGMLWGKQGLKVANFQDQTVLKLSTDLSTANRLDFQRLEDPVGVALFRRACGRVGEFQAEVRHSQVVNLLATVGNTVCHLCPERLTIFGGLVQPDGHRLVGHARGIGWDNSVSTVNDVGKKANASCRLGVHRVEL